MNRAEKPGRAAPLQRDPLAECASRKSAPSPGDIPCSATNCESAELHLLTLDALDLEIAVLDTAGRILQVNEAWRSNARKHGDPGVRETGIGTDYLAACRHATEAAQPYANQALAGIQAVLHGTKRSFRLEYPCGTHADMRWFLMTVSALPSQRRGAVVAHLDITERKRAEQALVESESRYRTLVELSPDAIFVNDEDRITFINDAGLRLLGASDRRDVVGKSPLQFFHPSRHSVIRERIRNVLQTGEPAPPMEQPLLRLDGTVLPVEVTAAAIPRGDHRALQVVARDVSDRKRSEAINLTRQLLLHSFVQQAPAAIAMFDRKMRYLAVSQQWSLEFGRGRQDLTGLSHYEVFPDLPDRWKAIHRRCLAGETISSDEDFWVKPLGGATWLKWVAKPWIDERGSIGGILIMSEDITRRKQVEEAVRTGEERLRLVLEASRIGIYELDLDNHTVYWSPTIFALLGLEPDQLSPSPESFFRFVQSKDVARVRSQFETALQTGTFRSEFRIIRADGEERWLAGMGFLAGTDPDASPAPHGAERRSGRFLGINYDITERRRMEAELLEITDREQRRIGQDLHDGLGQQLTGIELKHFLLMEGLKRELRRDLPPEFRRQSEAISELLHECIAATRSIALDLAPVALRTQGLAGALRQLVRRTSMPGQVRCRFFCRDPIVLDDSQIEKHLYRIAQEAVNNALKHSRTRRIEIHLANWRDGTIELKIRDFGRGLPQRRKASSGMGLEVMRHRAQTIGAFLEFHSKRGAGLTVTCTLPGSGTPAPAHRKSRSEPTH